MGLSTFMGLETSLRGLLAQQQALDTTSHNIANASTTGYSRQVAVFQASPAYTMPGVTTAPAGPGQIGTGVDVAGYQRIRDAFLGEDVDGDLLRADVSVSQREAQDGLVVSLQVPVRVTCPHCGGRGETWTERCDLCRGSGHSTFDHPLRLTLPPRVADGACFRSRLKSPDSTSVRGEVRRRIRSSAA